MDVFNLSFKYCQKTNYFASIHLQGNEVERELVFHFIWEKDKKPSNFWDSESQSDLMIKRIDHITFHKDGRVHLAYYQDRKRYFQENSMPAGISKLPENSYITLLLISINSIHDFSQYMGRSIIKEIKGNRANLLWNYKKDSLSVGIFIISNKLDPIHFLTNKFPSVFDIGNIAWFPYAVNKKIGLLFAPTFKLIDYRNIKFVNPRFIKNNNLRFDNIPTLELALMPSDTRINSLI